MKKIKLGNQSCLYPYPSTIISIEVDGRKNFMQLGFVGIVNANPGMIAMGVARNHFSARALEKGKVFALAIVNEEMLLKADYVGIRPGDKFDKSEVFETIKGDNGSNIIIESPINLEVKILEILDLGGVDYTVIAEILEVYADENVLSNKNPDIEKINPIMLSMYENKYFKVGSFVGNAWRDGLEYERISKFVVETIFQAFDELSENEYFKQYIADDTVFDFADNKYFGYEGFCTWLDGIRNILKSEGLKHIVKNLNAKKLDNNRFQVSFFVDTIGEMKSGKLFETTFKESWILKAKNNTYVIESYVAR